MHSNQENINYWPGFVDAIMNVLLNILFMLCIMSFALGQVQDKASDTANANESSKTKIDSFNDNVSHQTLTFPHQKTISSFAESYIQLKPTPSPSKTMPNVSIAANLNDPSQDIWSLEFTSDSQQISKEVKVHLKTLIPQIIKSQDVFVVWAVDTEEIDNTNKLLLNRLLAVRNALLENGVAADRIEVRMVPGETNKNTHTVYLTPVSNLSPNQTTQ